MESERPVYQATTVTYEQQQGWPLRYPLQHLGISFSQARCIQWLLVLGGSFTLAAGLVMVIVGALATNYNADAAEGVRGGVVVAIVGGLMVLLGLMMLVAYFKILRRRSVCPCCPAKEIRLVRQMKEGHSAANGQGVATGTNNQDGPIAAQYAPVAEISYQPPAGEGEEHAKLMGNESKDCHDDTERMLDDDPRIVLRPLRQVDEY